MTQNLCACLGELVDKICSGDPKPLEAAAVVRAAPAAAPTPPERALPVEAPAATLAVPNVPLETEKSEVGLEVWKHPLAIDIKGLRPLPHFASSIEHTINGIRWGTCGFSGSDAKSPFPQPQVISEGRASESRSRVSAESRGSTKKRRQPPVRSPRALPPAVLKEDPASRAFFCGHWPGKRNDYEGEVGWDESGWTRKGVESG